MKKFLILNSYKYIMCNSTSIGWQQRGLKSVPRVDLDQIIQRAFLSTCAGTSCIRPLDNKVNATLLRSSKILAVTTGITGMWAYVLPVLLISRISLTPNGNTVC